MFVVFPLRGSVSQTGVSMSDQSHSWYIRGEGNQPAGPFPSEELIQSWRAGRLDANTICWREGMSQWLPMSQVEPFASAIASANASRQATAGAARWPAPPTGVSSSPSTGSRPAGRPTAPPAWIGWAIAGGIAAICAFVAGVILLLNVCHKLGQFIHRGLQSSFRR